MAQKISGQKLLKGNEFNGNALSLAAFLKFMFSKKATKNAKIFTLDLTICSKCQIEGEDFINFGGLLRKYEL